MIGMDRHSGQVLAGDAHLSQSITDILTTRIGERVMRRDYGSRLPALVDSPINGRTVIEFFVATVEALRKWEPRIRVQRVQLLNTSDAGNVEISVDYAVDGRAETTGVTIGGGSA